MRSNCRRIEPVWLGDSLTDCPRERMFAKPFIAQLGKGHVQGVYSMCKVRGRLGLATAPMLICG